ncbi:MAG: thermonuclease family protein [Deltaproteobacteria bacterium]|nr:thermonuclease family protein [Deltaproteobacteria bacterium]
MSVLWGGEADAVSGCCSRHHGVCDCQCCDGTPLSDTCRSRMPDCGGTQNAPGRLKKTSLPGTFVAWVIHVKDGDTIAVEYKKQKISIRLADIDCPEFKQPFGIEALEFTERQVLNQNVEIHVRAIDRYGRAVADVRMSSGESLNTALIKAGLAWWYKNYSKDRQIEALEIKARNAKRGLWSQPDPLPPWVYRRQNRVDKT